MYPQPFELVLGRASRLKECRIIELPWCTNCHGTLSLLEGTPAALRLAPAMMKGPVVSCSCMVRFSN